MLNRPMSRYTSNTEKYLLEHFIHNLYVFTLFNESLIFLVDCKWDEWSECQNLDCKGDGLSPSTGTGMKHRLIKFAESNGGKACSGGETKPCIEPCPGI